MNVENAEANYENTFENIYGMSLRQLQTIISDKTTFKYILNLDISFAGKDNAIGIQKGAAFLPEKQT